MYPISSIISTLYFAKNFSRVSSLFSWSADFNWFISFSNVMKYVMFLAFAQLIPMAVARCVLPVPLEPTNSILSCLSRNLRVLSSSISFLLMSGWKSKSKSSTVLMNGKFAVLTFACSLRVWLCFLSIYTSSSRASVNDLFPRFTSSI